MRIAVDNLSAGEATTSAGPGGMRMYLREMVNGLSRHVPDAEIVLLTAAGGEPLLDVVPPNVNVTGLAHVPVSRALRVVYQQTLLAKAVRDSEADVLFAPATVMPLAQSVPTVLAVQFLQFYRWPSAYGALRTRYLRAILPRSVAKAARVISFTEAAKEELIAQTGADPGKIAIVPHGLPRGISDVHAPRGAVARVVGAEVPFILYVSALYPYKNQRLLIEAFAALRRRRSIPHRLVLVGGEAGTTVAELRDFAREQGVGEHVVVAGRVRADEDVWELYRNATMMTFPSPFETFGFPPLEAMACGCPVIVPFEGGSGELVGDAGLRVDVGSAEALAGAMERLIVDDALRARLIEQGRLRASRYTWDASAKQTAELIREAASH